MAINFRPEELENVRAHAARDYPSECCGILLGHADGESKEVSEVVPLRNLRHDPGRAQELLPVEDPSRESERNRFLIDPQDQLRVEKDSRQRGLDVLGYYHSHPDHPARPSNYDREHAWPWYSYVILSVERAEAKDVTSWVLSNDRSRFEQEDLKMR
ncbi:MAG: M67 family metallopeptidase [Acidobacteria bacterium]|nr:M67 family metallopeptidase [Acidobacteriota bacterium]